MRAATVPATWVPWPWPSLADALGSQEEALVVQFTLFVTWPCKSTCEPMPVSRTATGTLGLPRVRSQASKASISASFFQPLAPLLLYAHCSPTLESVGTML